MRMLYEPYRWRCSSDSVWILPWHLVDMSAGRAWANQWRADMKVPSESFRRSSLDSRTCYPSRATNEGLIDGSQTLSMPFRQQVPNESIRELWRHDCYQPPANQKRRCWWIIYVCCPCELHHFPWVKEQDGRDDSKERISSQGTGP